MKNPFLLLERACSSCVEPLFDRLFPLAVGDRLTYRLRLVRGYPAWNESRPLLGHLRIGRDPACELSLQSLGVSWHHGRFEREEHGGVLYEDLGSTNGSFVNGQRVTQRRLLQGDVLRVGDCELVVE